MRMRLAEAVDRADRARLATSPAESDAIVEPFSEIPIGLGRGNRVRFFLDGASYDSTHSYVDVRVNEWGELELTGGRALAIFPRVSNVITLKISER